MRAYGSIGLPIPKSTRKQFLSGGLSPRAALPEGGSRGLSSRLRMIQYPASPCAGPVMHAAGISSREDAKTRRMRSHGCPCQGSCPSATIAFWHAACRASRGCGSEVSPTLTRGLGQSIRVQGRSRKPRNFLRGDQGRPQAHGHGPRASVGLPFRGASGSGFGRPARGRRQGRGCASRGVPMDR